MRINKVTQIIPKGLNMNNHEWNSWKNNIRTATPEGLNNHTPTYFYKPEIPSGFSIK